MVLSCVPAVSQNKYKVCYDVLYLKYTTFSTAYLHLSKLLDTVITDYCPNAT